MRPSKTVIRSIYWISNQSYYSVQVPIVTHLKVSPLSGVTRSLRINSAPGTEQIGLFQQSRTGLKRLRLKKDSKLTYKGA